MDTPHEAVDLVGFVAGVDEGLPGEIAVCVELHLAAADREDAKPLG